VTDPKVNGMHLDDRSIFLRPQVLERTFIAAIVLVLALCCSQTQDLWADVYSWADDGGVIHVTDSLDKIPPAHRGQAVLLGRSPETLAAAPADYQPDYVISFEKTPSRTIFVDVLLNSTIPAKMILDTGAGMVVLSEDLARRLNLESGRETKTLLLQTAGGEVQGRSATLTKVELGAVHKENVRAAVNTAPNVFKGFDGLLGMSFLEDFKVVIDYANNRILLKKSCTAGHCEEP
jgi:clan AA aspartic protease (TIGR02281 family)